MARRSARNKALANAPAGVTLPPALADASQWYPVPIVGECQVCGCTDDQPCQLAPETIIGDGEPLTCSWVDPAHTLCSNPRCVAEIPLAQIEALCRL